MRPDMPADLRELLESCWQLDPSKRPTAAQLEQRLQDMKAHSMSEPGTQCSQNMQLLGPASRQHPTHNAFPPPARQQPAGSVDCTQALLHWCAPAPFATMSAFDSLPAVRLANRPSSHHTNHNRQGKVSRYNVSSPVLLVQLCTTSVLSAGLEMVPCHAAGAPAEQQHSPAGSQGAPTMPSTDGHARQPTASPFTGPASQQAPPPSISALASEARRMSLDAGDTPAASLSAHSTPGRHPTRPPQPADIITRLSAEARRMSLEDEPRHQPLGDLMSQLSSEARRMSLDDEASGRATPRSPLWPEAPQTSALGPDCAAWEQQANKKSVAACGRATPRSAVRPVAWSSPAWELCCAAWGPGVRRAVSWGFWAGVPRSAAWSHV